MSIRPPSSARERVDWLRLIRADNVGPATFASLITRFGSAAAALEALPRLAARGGAKGFPRIPSLGEVEREAEALQKRGGCFLARGEPGYPLLLGQIHDAPPLLAVLGQTRLLAAEGIAMVGARNASAAGLRLARILATELGRAGLVIVSGLARGIDTAAHEAALSSGTVGVLAGGIDVVYPPENQRLYEAMAAQGALIAEMPLGTAPQARHFPRRNRLISGLSRAVLVVEAAERSGSLITARLALEQDREVMAVPGSPLDPRSHGSNKLIQAGARLVQSAQDVLDELANAPPHRFCDRDLEPFAGLAAGDDEAALDALRPVLLERLGPTPVEIDELIRQTGAPVQAVLGILLELEVAGRLERQPGQKVCLLTCL